MLPFYVEKSIGFENIFQNLYSLISTVKTLLFFERWTGWVKLLQRSVPIKKKENKKAICLLSSPDRSDTLFNGQRALRQSSG